MKIMIYENDECAWCKTPLGDWIYGRDAGDVKSALASMTAERFPPELELLRDSPDTVNLKFNR